MAKPFNMHPSDDQLDLYLVGDLPLSQQSWLEDHYLFCPRCLNRLLATADFIAVLKAALAKCPELGSHRNSGTIGPGADIPRAWSRRRVWSREEVAGP